MLRVRKMNTIQMLKLTASAQDKNTEFLIVQPDESQPIWSLYKRVEYICVSIIRQGVCAN